MKNFIVICLETRKVIGRMFAQNEETAFALAVFVYPKGGIEVKPMTVWA